MQPVIPSTQAPEVRTYFCPYCGWDYKDSSWTTDHVIPAAFGGPNKFAVVACRLCNGWIGKEIEQPILSTDSFKTALGEMLLSGERIKRRRNKRFISMNAVGLVYKGTFAKFRYDTKELTRQLVFFSEPDGLTPEQMLEKKRLMMLYPASDHDRNKQLELRLMDKLLLGCGHWLWGEKFSRSTYSALLRKQLREGTDEEEVLDMRPEEKHLVMKDEKGGEVDALDNAPDTTIGFFEEWGRFLGLVNLLGGYESLSSLGKLDPSIDLGIKRGIVVIARSTRNEVIRMNLDEYERFKDAEDGTQNAKTHGPTPNRDKILRHTSKN